MKYISILLLLIPSYLYTQNADEIINNVKKNIDLIDKFEAEFDLRIELQKFKIPDRKGKLFYEKPDSTRYEVEGFSMMPKQGLGNYVNRILNIDALLMYSGEVLINDNKAHIIKVIPKNNDGDIVISTLCIDKKSYTVLKSEITTKNNGTFLVESAFIKIKDKYYLPSKTIISFQVPKYKMPKAFTGDTRKQKEDKNPNSLTTKGKVIINYFNYKVN